MTPDRTSDVQDCLDRLRRGDPGAREELIRGAADRLAQLTRVMLRDYRRLRRWEQTDDVLQNALVRLCRALEQSPPDSPRAFYRLAALQIRRELIDLVRHHFGPEGPAAHHATDPGESAPRPEPAEPSGDPSRLSAWADFHRLAGELPDDLRDVFDLIWYQGMTHAEAAAVLAVSTKTVQRRWHSACLRLHDAIGGDLPGP